MKVLYLDCQFGISGDMTLSALIDLGADVSYVRNQLQKLPIDPFTMDFKQVDKKGISSKKLVLDFEELLSDEEEHQHHHRQASTILQMIEDSKLPARVKERSVAVFKEIAKAEGKIHGVTPDEVHFHEVGAMDSIIDVIGVCLALESLDVGRVIGSPVPTGYGKVKIEHGLYPIPAPATAEILKGVPLADFHVKGELTTPTGAGFLKVLADSYEHFPPFTIEKIGYGAGTKDFEHPNILRAVLFKQKETPDYEKIFILECQLDDFTGEAIGYIMEKILEQGVLDIYLTSVAMKKNRPGTLITILIKEKDVERIEEILLRETSTFGVRKSEWSRRILDREFKKVETEYGRITVKIGRLAGEIVKISPEYEEVKEKAIQMNIPLMELYFEVKQAAREQLCEE